MEFRVTLVTLMSVILSLLSLTESTCSVAGYKTNTHSSRSEGVNNAIVDLTFNRIGDKYCMKDFNLSYIDMDIQIETQGQLVILTPEYKVEKNRFCTNDFGYKSIPLGESIDLKEDSIVIRQAEIDTGVYSCFPDFYHAKAVTTIQIDLKPLEKLRLIESYYIVPIMNMSYNNTFKLIRPSTDAKYIHPGVLAQKLDPPIISHASIYVYEHSQLNYGLTTDLLRQSLGTCAWLISINHHLSINDFQLNCLKAGGINSINKTPKLSSGSKYDVSTDIRTYIRLTLPDFSKSVVELNGKLDACRCSYTEGNDGFLLKVKNFKDYYIVENQMFHSGENLLQVEPQFVLCNNVVTECRSIKNATTVALTRKYQFLSSTISEDDLKVFILNHLWLTIVTILCTIVILKKI